jgi:multiple sugar transport system substrate-binding protein
MRSMRRIARMMATTLAVVTLASCAGRADGRAEIVLRMTSWQSPEENALDVPAVQAFERAHPGVRVVNEPISNQAEYREKVFTSVAAGSPPDVVLIDGIDVPAFLDADVMLDLTRFAPRVGMRLDDFYPSVLAMFAREDKVIGFPKGFSPMVFYYNRALFDSAGVPYPRDGWTFDDFARTTRALTRDTNGDGTPDIWGTVLLRPFYAWQAWIWSGGGDILSPDGTRASGFLDARDTRATLDFLTSLPTRLGVAPKPNAFRQVTGNETRLFYSGRLALMTSGHWLIPQIRRAMARGQLSLGVVSIPHAAGHPVRTPLFASAWGVPRNSRHRKLAVELAAALSNADAQRHRLASGLELSTIPAVQRELAERDSLGLERAFLAQVPYGEPPWGARIAKFREVEAQLPEMLDRVLINHESVDAVTTDVARRIDRILAR